MPQIQQILQAIHEVAPWDLAESWDRVGLQVDRNGQNVKKLLIALEMNRQVIDEGIKSRVDGFLVHHPLIFKPLTKLTPDSPLGGNIYKLIQNNQFVIAAHTNIDKSEKGLNQYLAEMLNLNVIETLEPVSAQFCKVVVFCPVEQIDKLRLALVESGAGEIGNYTECSFGVNGIGTFRSGIGTTPYIGENSEFNKVSETRLEMILPQRMITKTLNTINNNHPYEEPAIDIYPLLNNSRHGLGRVGDLPKPISFHELCSNVKECFQLTEMRIVGEANSRVQRIAICSGSGRSLLTAAIAQKADVFISADFGYHDYLTAQENGLKIIDAGHWGTEHLFVEMMATYLRRYFEAESDFEIVPNNTIHAEPYITLV